MIRPRHFGYNTETAASNTFQRDTGEVDSAEISRRAVAEFDDMVDALRTNGIHVDVFEDTDEPVKPDAVFPNNWFSTHADGSLITYPMFSPSRRNERRADILDALAGKYDVTRRYAFEQFEEQDLFLEGTGSLVLDRVHHIAYACLSDRTDIRMLDKFCVLKGYRHVPFVALADKVRIYHTNVVMALGTGYVVICLECVPDENHRKALVSAFEETGKEIIEISYEQMTSFTGNMLQLKSSAGQPVCVMSQQALDSLTPAQRTRLEQYNPIVSSPLFVIETYGGGSARCMIAENFLKPL